MRGEGSVRLWDCGTVGVGDDETIEIIYKHQTESCYC